MCLYLFVPILVVIVYSFNSSKLAAGVRRAQHPLVPRVLERPADQGLARRELRGRGRDDGRGDDPRDAARLRAGACARAHRRIGQHPHAAAADHARDRHGGRPAAAVRARRHDALAEDDHPRPHHVLDLVRHGDRARAPVAAQPRGRGGRDGSRRHRARCVAARHVARAVSGDRGLGAARIRPLLRRFRHVGVRLGRGHLAVARAHLLSAARRRLARDQRRRHDHDRDHPLHRAGHAAAAAVAPPHGAPGRACAPAAE